MKNHLSYSNYRIDILHIVKVVLICFLLSVVVKRSYGQGNLFIAPKRVVFEGRERVKELNLSNISQDTARYQISLIHYRMNVDGGMELIQTPEPNTAFADSFVRFYPRSVILAPGESQVIRIQLTQTDKLENREYRSHLYLRAISNDSDGSRQEKRKTDSTSFSIQLRALVGVAVPVFIQVGESTTHIALSHCSFEKTNRPTVQMNLDRTGNMSFYGDVAIDYISPDGAVTRVSNVKGIAVYAPNLHRHLTLPLNSPAAVDYTQGKLHIVYLSPENQNPNTIAQTEIYLH